MLWAKKRQPRIRHKSPGSEPRTDAMGRSPRVFCSGRVLKIGDPKSPWLSRCVNTQIGLISDLGIPPFQEAFVYPGYNMYIWAFPGIGEPPNWMVYNGTSYLSTWMISGYPFITKPPYAHLDTYLYIYTYIHTIGKYYQSETHTHIYIIYIMDLIL
jgi:hypothetical protein